ncbi:Uncharacterised protein [Streptococcus pneumoniae]|nr:Uncharacterised protein [Streptococcus pneumoniae]CAG5363840.1 Uncharacterised protein [Streptococcus pneumoniae]CAG5427513.1 Uncharacterised protein [Streptococcus pneumoniae]CAG5608515.1 Uncharacterised protein [Streptococcus pneumoniae]CAG5633176.1 Uncharacterised protein [Streptococcus pneumoniae]
MKNALVFHQNTFPLFLLEIKFIYVTKTFIILVYYLLSIEKAVYLNYTLNLQKSLKIEMRFHTLFYIIWGYNNTYHEIYTVGVTHITNRSKNGLRQLRRIPSIQLPCADERWSSCRLFFRKSRTCSGAISNSKAFIL